MATLQQVKNKVDPVLAALALTLDARQATYATNHGGRYFQGFWTNVGEIVDAVDTAPDNLDSRPSDQIERWTDFAQAGDLPALLPCRLCCDVYQNTNGWGYVLTVEVTWNGEIYTRARNMQGNETARTFAWQKKAIA